ncbi:IclR family transcriptional regulator [Antrihabitans stalactiti]|uniref:IclR family transcriptional regulator n=1 Tax=Antrihabitans stalactiti TaxID=2584121 RepID=A0A848KI90_9NOCA|nr:IclR family transcriptional regulator C-terminal domain-containing protein [Antrihabitans stalactiti]NMN95950.1 IclR family transcriptional regulator [Antrihabitans stalactiti]
MSPLRDPSRHHPSAVSNSLRIIEAIAVLGLGVSAKEIASALHMPTATAYRLLNALVADEYVVRTSDLRGFGLGARLDGLITAASVPVVPFAARSALDELRQSVRFAVHVIDFHAGALRVLDADPDHPIQAERELVRHLHASAAGKTLLAYSPSWRDALPKKLIRLTTHTVTDLSALRSHLDELRRVGFAIQIDELADGLTCTAVPILDFDGTTRGALCLAGPSSRKDAILTHIDAARACAMSLGPLLY